MYDKGTEPMMDYGLNNDEMRELQAQLAPGEFEALLQVQRQLLDEPMVTPADGFTERMMSRLAAREQQQARRRSTFGAIGFVAGSLVLTALLIWTSPLGTLVQVSGWAALLDSALSLWSSGMTVAIIMRSFVGALWEDMGSTSLLLFALLAFALTLVWTRVVAGAGLLNRSEIAKH